MAAAGQAPQPTRMYVLLRELLMVIGNVPMGVASWGALIMDDYSTAAGASWR